MGDELLGSKTNVAQIKSSSKDDHIWICLILILIIAFFCFCCK